MTAIIIGTILASTIVTYIWLRDVVEFYHDRGLGFPPRMTSLRNTRGGQVRGAGGDAYKPLGGHIFQGRGAASGTLGGSNPSSRGASAQEEGGTYQCGQADCNCQGNPDLHG